MNNSNSYNIWIFGRHLGFPVEGGIENVGMGTVEKLAPENMGVAAGILFLSSVDLKKPPGCNLPPPPPPRWLGTCVKQLGIQRLKE